VRLVDVVDGMPEVVQLVPICEPGLGFLPLRWHLDEKAAAVGVSTLRIDSRGDPVIAECELLLPGRDPLRCAVEIVQTGAVTFTRNTPILESSVLRTRSVLCVGVGSGGSIVVDQLARAGVGRFTLWDRDRLEAHNIGRHVCTLRDLGRRKVWAMRDHVRTVNPAAEVICIDKDVLRAEEALEAAVAEADCVIAGTDNNASRFAINSVAWRHGKPSLYGRAFTRAAGGDVIQVIPGKTPCYACHVKGRVVEEEIASQRDADRVAYADAPVPVEPGLVIDIHPVANMTARLALLRLCENLPSSLQTVAKETDAPLYLWANRRDGQFENWEPMERTFDRLSIFRWYAIDVARNKECRTCRAGSAA